MFAVSYHTAAVWLTHKTKCNTPHLTDRTAELISLHVSPVYPWCRAVLSLKRWSGFLFHSNINPTDLQEGTPNTGSRCAVSQWSLMNAHERFQGQRWLLNKISSSSRKLTFLMLLEIDCSSSLTWKNQNITSLFPHFSPSLITRRMHIGIQKLFVHRNESNQNPAIVTPHKNNVLGLDRSACLQVLSRFSLGSLWVLRPL